MTWACAYLKNWSLHYMDVTLQVKTINDAPSLFHQLQCLPGERPLSLARHTKGFHRPPLLQPPSSPMSHQHRARVFQRRCARRRLAAWLAPSAGISPCSHLPRGFSAISGLSVTATSSLKPSFILPEKRSCPTPMRPRPSCTCVQFLWTPAQMITPGGLNKTHVFSHGSRSQNSGVKGSAGLCSPWRLKEATCPMTPAWLPT